MRRLLDLQKRLFPDLDDVLRKRHAILRQVRSAGTLGRRSLAASLNMTERVLRAEVEFLRQQGLLRVGPAGISLTDEGAGLLDDLEPVVRELFGLADLEDRLRQRYGLRQAAVVPGDAQASAAARLDLGRAGAAVLRKYAAKGSVIAVGGGSTMAVVAEQLTATASLKDCLFVPARGGLGESVELQAGTIASAMAKRTGAQYRLLHVPDHLGEEAYQSLMQDPSIRDVVATIRSARIIVHGIGEAFEMARRRGLDALTVEALRRSGARGEAFGYFFDAGGRVVHKTPTVGIRLEDLPSAATVIAIAGGSSKVPAIDAVMRSGYSHVLVTDEAAARAILTGETT